MRPSVMSRSTVAMLIVLQLLDGLRGVHRCRTASSSTRWATESIHPQHSASTTAASHVRPRSGTCFLYSPIHSSVAESWWAASHAANSSGPEKNVAGRSGVPPGVPIMGEACHGGVTAREVRHGQGTTPAPVRDHLLDQ